MDDLAQEVGVSRRTLFNHVDDKASAVLGPNDVARNESNAAALAAFIAGGPSGRLYPDLIAVFRNGPAETPTDDEIDDIRQLQEVLAADPTVAGLLDERLQRNADALVQAVAQRESWAVDDLRAQAVVAVVMALLRTTVTRMAAEPSGRPLTVIFGDVCEAYEATR